MKTEPSASITPSSTPADHAAQDRAEAADHDDLEALEGRDRAVLRVDEEVGREQRAGRRGQRHADPEGQHVEPQHVDAGGLDADPVLRGAPERAPDPGPRDQQVEERRAARARRPAPRTGCRRAAASAASSARA